MSFAATFGLSFTMGCILFALSIFLGWISQTYQWNDSVLKWALLPTLGYAIALGLNSGIQQVTCKKVSIKQIAIGATTLPIAILLFLGLSLVGFVRAPIEQAVPLAYRLQYGTMISLGFYMFWAGMFGEGLAGGLAQACPAS